MTYVRRAVHQQRGFISDHTRRTEQKLGKQHSHAEGAWAVWSVAGLDHPGIAVRNSFCVPRRYKFTGSTSRGSVSIAGGFARGRRKASHSQLSAYAAIITSFAPLNSRVAVSEVGV